MRILIYEPERIHRRGFNGFYRHFLSALVSQYAATPTSRPRPLPRLLKPREHESCWVEWDDRLLFFDMSDHVQLFDFEALTLCSVYFKANLHRGIALRLLTENGLEKHERKLAPFLFFSEGLGDFMRDARRRRFWRLDRPQYDVCFVMGVYENPVRDGGRSPFEHPDVPMTPAACHFWMRWHMMNALRDAGIPGYYRLTSRGHRALEDAVNVFSNLGRRTFSRRMTDGRITAVCTFPHALFPWKASESFVLGRPILIEQTPLTETPAPFAPVAGKHYLEFLPRAGRFDAEAPLAESASHRVLARVPLDAFHERAAWLKTQLADHARMKHMGAACQAFAEKAYAPEAIAGYIANEIEKRL